MHTPVSKGRIPRRLFYVPDKVPPQTDLSMYKPTPHTGEEYAHMDETAKRLERLKHARQKVNRRAWLKIFIIICFVIIAFILINIYNRIFS